MISTPRPTRIAGGSSDSVAPVKWQELDTTTMVEDESKLGTAFTAASPGSEWEGFGERNEHAVVFEKIFGTFLMASSVLANAVIVIMTEFRIRRASRLSSFYYLLGHLAIADLFVTCAFLPMQMGWIGMESEGLDRSWAAESNEACTAVGFFHLFGSYLSSLVIVAVILDRYNAVLRPLGAWPALDRAKIMALAAYIASGLFSLPDAIFYHVETSPFTASVKTCTPDSPWRSVKFELTYAVCQTFIMYALPIITILTCCPQILRHLRPTMQRGNLCGTGGTSSIPWTKFPSIQLSFTIALTFVIFWMPYHFCTLWSWIDSESFLRVSATAVKTIILFLASANSCLNPIVQLYHRLWRTQAKKIAEGVVTRTRL